MRHAKAATPTVLLILVIFGCSSRDERLVELAREHAAQQAESQRRMTDLQKQVADGSRQLVEADARARQELTALQREMQVHQAEIGRERDKMEAERREIAANRFRDPVIAAIIMEIGIVLACLFPLALGAYALWSARRTADSDSAVAELLVQELVASEPRLLLPVPSSLPSLEPPGTDSRDDDIRRGRK